MPHGLKSLLSFVVEDCVGYVQNLHQKIGMTIIFHVPDFFLELYCFKISSNIVNMSVRLAMLMSPMSFLICLANLTTSMAIFFFSTSDQGEDLGEDLRTVMRTSSGMMLGREESFPLCARSLWRFSAGFLDYCIFFSLWSSSSTDWCQAS